MLSALTLIACADKNVVKQRIMSAGDCKSNSGWSWNNGVATADNKCDYGEYHSFSFAAKPSGILTFSYKFDSRSHYYSDKGNYGSLAITIGKTPYFKDEFQEEDSKLKWIKVDAGSVESGDVIVVSGYNCSVKNIIITGSLPVTEDTIPSSTPWDF